MKTRKDVQADFEAMDMLKDNETTSGYYGDIESILDSLDDGICSVMDKHIAKNFTSKNGYLFFEDDDILDSYEFAMNILKRLIKHTHKKEDEVNAFFDKIQTGKNQRINIDNNETCPTCDQYPYSDIDDMCPVCGQSTSKTIEICPIPTEVGTVRISLIDDEKDAILNKEVSLDFPFTINGNELWVFEGDENKAKTNLGIN